MQGLIDAVADAIERAQCKGREGPYGIFDYMPYGAEVSYLVRDFRDVQSQSYGDSVFKTTDRDGAQRIYSKLTREHLAKEAINAVLGYLVNTTLGDD